MVNDGEDLIDWNVFSRARTELGAGFIRILGYFREDGTKAIAAIEDAIRNRNAAALVLPAHTLKGEALQFGAEPLAALAEHIEQVARRCVEIRLEPDELVADVVRLGPMFEKTMAQIDREASPLMARRANGGFGRRGPTALGNG